jgi:hypothetical protein
MQAELKSRRGEATDSADELIKLANSVEYYRKEFAKVKEEKHKLELSCKNMQR